MSDNQDSSDTVKLGEHNLQQGNERRLADRSSVGLRHLESYRSAQNALKQAIDCLKQKSYQSAIANFKIAIQNNGELAEAHFYLGLTYFMLNDYEQARLSYQQAIKCESGDPTVHENLGIVCQLLDQHQDAVSAFTYAVALDPKRAESYSRLGNSLQKLGKREEAKAAYQQAVLAKLKSEQS
ncbi:hypothetical protein CMK18_04865 [Candidatus Poribacteria bacterium]|nr:hypothetical protein [Candidatus Poribacteria bacterium]